MLPPSHHTFDTIWGHDRAKRALQRMLATGRLPHALLLTGPDAIGKRSLAFALAKAILSAGRPTSAASINAPAPPAAKRRVDDDGDPEADLFGGGDEDDLFAAEEDLFGGATEEQESPAVAAVPAPTPEPPPPSVVPVASAALAAPTAKLTPRFTGYDARVCRLVENGYPLKEAGEGGGHLDLSIIEPGAGRRSILVKQVRDMQDVASISPVEGAYRVILIFGADTITEEAGNSILKLLEEPPGYLVLILVANQAAKVLQTIRSRCSMIPMMPLETDVLTEKLIEHEKLSPERARVAAVLSEGRPGAALSLIESDTLEKRREVFESRLQLDRFGNAAIPASAARIAATTKLDEALWLLLSFARDRFVNHVAPGREKLLVHRDAEDLISHGEVDVYTLDEEIDRLLAAYSSLNHPFTPNAKAVLQKALWPEG